MNPFDPIKTLAGFWNVGGAELVQAQQKLFLNVAMQTTKAFAGTQESLLAHLNIFDPGHWLTMSTMDTTLHRAVMQSACVDVYKSRRKLVDLIDAAANVRKYRLEYDAVMLDAWMQAAGIFIKQLDESAEEDAAPRSMQELLALWVDIANETLLETQRSGRYLVAQRELLKANTDLRLAQQEIASFYAEMLGYPTRAELDEVHKTVTELRRELRAMKREVHETESEHRATNATNVNSRRSRTRRPEHIS